MLRASVNWNACRACDPCSARAACRTRAIVQVDAGEPALIDGSRCSGCGACLPVCPYGAIALESAALAEQRGLEKR